MSGRADKYISKAEESILHTYNRFPVVFESGEGMYLRDVEGRDYLDFGAGIAVCSLGYSCPELNMALTEQVSKLLHTSNLFYHTLLDEAGEPFLRRSGMSKVFFTNSGAEAIEGALKAARKYSYMKGRKGSYEIVAMEHSFHGRTMGALSVTGTAHYREPFEPLIGGVRFASFNDIESVRENITDKTCAVIMETVQGEGGIYPADAGFLKEVRKLCDDRDILLILDEIQCGMGRCGSYFAYEEYGVMPDIMASAKALGCGVPVGAFALNEKCAVSSLVPGDHGSTYGGNPLALSAVKTVFSVYEKRDIISHVRSITPYFEEVLDRLVKECDVLKGRRGKGLLQGLVCEAPVGEVINASLQEGLIVLSAGQNVIRLAPPLILEREHIDLMYEKLKKVLTQRS